MGLMLLASLFFSFGTVFVVLLQARIPVSEIIIFRNLIALAFIVPVLIKNRTPLRTPRFKLHAVRGFWAYLNVSLFYWSFRYLNFVDATILNAAYAFFVPFVALFWLKEPMQARIWWAIGLGFLGVICIVQPQWDMSNFGLLIALGAAIAAAFSFSSVRLLNLQEESLLRSYFYFYLIGSIIVAPFSIGVWAAPTMQEWAYLILLGLSMSANQVLLTKAYQLGPASFISPVTYSTIAFSALLNWAVFNQSIGFGSILGSLLIAIGGFLTVFKRRREEATS
jgi:drug/metabolite transporter (DMT)-like permease